MEYFVPANQKVTHTMFQNYVTQVLRDIKAFRVKMQRHREKLINFMI